MRLTYSNITTTIGLFVSIAVLLVSVGIWVGGTDAKTDFNEKLESIDSKIVSLNNRQGKFEKQIIVWLDDAAAERLAIFGNIKYLHEYNKRKDPEYVIPEIIPTPRTQMINKWQ